MIKPMISGIMLAMIAVIGNFPIPAVPSAIIVKNGPSFKVRIAVAPTSDSSPYSPARVA